MNRWLGVVLILCCLALSYGVHVLGKENRALLTQNIELSMPKKSAPNKLYLFGCKEPTIAVIVYSNGFSLALPMKQLRKIEQSIPHNFPIVALQDPSCLTPRPFL
jgi:hypothetical protein